MTRRALDLELQDAYWELPGGDYVPQGSAPSRLLEDSDELDASWTATVDSLKSEAGESKEVRRRIRAKVEDFEAQERADLAEAASAAAQQNQLVAGAIHRATARLARPLLSLGHAYGLISHRQ